MAKKETQQTTWLIPEKSPFSGFSLQVHSSALAGMLFEAARSYAEKAKAENGTIAGEDLRKLAYEAHAAASVIEMAGANSRLEIIPERRRA